MNLYETFSKVPDYRNPCGKRHKLEVILIIDLIASLAGYTGILSKNEFINSFRVELTQMLGSDLYLQYSLPNATTISRAKEKIKFSELNQLLYQYLQSNGYLEELQAIHIDGKAIKSSIENTKSNMQTLQALVNVFSGRFAIFSKYYNNKKQSEIHIFQDIIEMLGLTGLIITGDALHTQKKQ